MEEIDIHVAQEGETLPVIAAKYGLSILWLTQNNPRLAEIRTGDRINVAKPYLSNEPLSPIDSQIFDRIVPVDGFLTLNDHYIVFESNEDEDSMRINLHGYFDSELVLHPCESNECDNSLKDDSLALITVHYLDIPDDPTSIEIITFTGKLKELRRFREKLENIAHVYQTDIGYTIPDLMTYIQSTRRSKQQAHFKVSKLDMCGESSKLLSTKEINLIRESFSARYRSCKWHLCFRLSRDGSSYTQFTHQVKGRDSSVMIIKTHKGDIIGAFSASGFNPETCSVFSGETFVFTFYPSYSAFKWAKTTQFYISITSDELMIGGGGGAAIWLDGQFLSSFSEKCNAFNSPPLASSVQFNVVEMEIWEIK